MTSKNGRLIFKTFNPRITSAFGWRTSPITGKQQFHDGVDYGTNRRKLPQYPIEEGQVLRCGTDSSKAKFVYVQYDRLGYIGLNYHLDSISVRNGQKVNETTVLGLTGKTGRTTGIHLHFGWFKIDEWKESFFNRTWEDFETYTLPPKPIIKPEAAQTIKIGDNVVLKKNTRYWSNSVLAKIGIGGFILKRDLKTKITRIAKNGCFNITGDLGWFRPLKGEKNG